MEKRNKPAMFYIEDVFYDIIKELAQERDMTPSSYIRSVMVKDIMKKGRMPQALKDGVLVGMQSLLDEAEVA